MVAAAGIKGYYRYTDIFFKWSEKDVGNIIGPDNAAMLRGHLGKKYLNFATASSIAIDSARRPLCP